VVVLEHLLAKIDALVADEYARARNQFANLVLTLAAEAAAGVAASVFSFVHGFLFIVLRRGRRRGIMPPENLVGKAYALTADKYPRARDQTNAALALGLLAERALGSMPLDLVALGSASEDHPAATFSLTFSSSWLSFFVFSPGL